MNIHYTKSSDNMPQMEVDLTPALRIWAKKNGVRPADFGRRMGWADSYAWQVLRGKNKFSLDAIGNFIFSYGLDAFLEVCRIAKVDPKGRPLRIEREGQNG